MDRKKIRKYGLVLVWIAAGASIDRVFVFQSNSLLERGYHNIRSEEVREHIFVVYKIRKTKHPQLIEGVSSLIEGFLNYPMMILVEPDEQQARAILNDTMKALDTVMARAFARKTGTLPPPRALSPKEAERF